MNITRMRSEERRARISQMADSIKNAKDPDYDKLVMIACSEWGVTIRMAKEYLKIARFEVGK